MEGGTETPEALTLAVEYVARFVTQPKTKTAAENAVWQMSKPQFDTVWNQIAGKRREAKKRGRTTQN